MVPVYFKSYHVHGFPLFDVLFPQVANYILQVEIEPIEPTEPEPPAINNSCAGHCGDAGPVPRSSPACFCNQGCETFGDCCSDFALICSSE